MKHIHKITMVGYGSFKISAMYRGREISATTTNTSAIDRINCDDVSERAVRNGYTMKQAHEVLYSEIRRSNKHEA